MRKNAPKENEREAQQQTGYPEKPNRMQQNRISLEI